MDKQLVLATVSKYLYKLIYKPRLYRFDRTRKKTPDQALKLRKRMELFVPADDALVCLPKNEIAINKKIEKDGEMVLPSQVLDYFIDQSGYRAIMNYCICRHSNDCKDYPQESGCLFLGEAAKKIHPDMHRSVSKEEAKEYLKQCREKGLVHLVGRAKLDTLWLGIGPHDKLFTVCNCCPCCCISLATPFMAPQLTNWFHRMPGVEVKVTGDCTGCGTCQSACIYGGITMEDGQALITDQCRGCGRCVEVCPSQAIELTFSSESVQKTIDFLAPRVDVA